MSDGGKKYALPYRSQLQEKFEPGQTLVIKGIANDRPQRFSVSLHSKSANFSDGNDVPLHISFRFDEGCCCRGKVVCNTFSKGEWGKEKRKTNPIKKGEPVDLRIRAHDNKFQILIDQKEFKEYDYRLPLGNISHFSVDGDLKLSKVSWGGRYYPVPYESGMSFPMGKKLLILATPEKKARRFTINLLKRNGDIALHLDTRFDEKAVVRNAMEAGEWGNEERAGKLPFEKGVGFDLLISNEPTQFGVNINDHSFTNFAHRADPSDISGIQIQGDIELSGIQVQ